MKKNFFSSVSLIIFRVILIISILISLFISFDLPAAVIAAADITVTTTIDVIKSDGKCSLREAVIASNKDKSVSGITGECAPGNKDDTIILNEGTYSLTRTDNGNENSASTGDLDITGDLVIRGAGADKTFIDGSQLTDRLFQVISGRFTLIGVTLYGGKSRSVGGSIMVESTVSVHDSAIIGAIAKTSGGGIYNKLSGNLTLINTTIYQNSALINGGGLFNDGGIMTIINSTISENSTYGSGGGLWNNGEINLLNVTISKNKADKNFDGYGDGGGIFQNSGSFTTKNTIISGNFDSNLGLNFPDCSGQINSQGNNLIQNISGCSITGITTGNQLNLEAQLLPLSNNGGTTKTHALASNSPAVDAGDTNGCPVEDQRGFPRPAGVSCDIGAFEVQDPIQHNPFTVVTAGDIDDGKCTYKNCTFREALLAANNSQNGTDPDRIQFNLSNSDQFILPISAPLPEIRDALVIDGTSQPGYEGIPIVGLDGSLAGDNINGLILSSSNNQVLGMQITGFSGSGIVVHSGEGNTFSGNQIYGNGKLGIDLAGDLVTTNDVNDLDDGPNRFQNYPVLRTVLSGPESTIFEGRLNGESNQNYRVELFSNAECDSSGNGEGQIFLGNFNLMTNDQGNAFFSHETEDILQLNDFITATATAPDGSTSEFSTCVTAGPGNDSWTSAFPLTPGEMGVGSASISQYLDNQGQSRWYKFKIQPESSVIVTLTNLPANYDLTVYKDISSVYRTLSSPADLLTLGAEFAPDAFSPDAFSPDAFSPDAFSPDAFSPDAFSPDAFSPDAFSPDAFSPDAFSPDAFSPDAFSPDAFSPDAFSPDAFSPDAFSPDAFSPDAFSPDAFSGAQSRSLLAVSAFDGISSEGIRINTWDQFGDFYVRVRGRNGNFNRLTPYDLSVSVFSDICNNVSPVMTASDLHIIPGLFNTVILTSPDRMQGSPAEKGALEDRLTLLAARPEVNGVVIDLTEIDSVAAAYAQADANPQCPVAQNILAGTIKDIISSYRAVNPLQYVVLVGGDNVIPFFRHADHALLGNEKNYIPPVLNNSASQASLKSGYFLSQDDYGSSIGISSKIGTLPIIDLAVGRLVETASDSLAVLDAYLGTADGVLPSPDSVLVTGYDFLQDAADAVKMQLETGTGVQAETLIQSRDLSPNDPSAWTADQLRSALFDSRHDLIFLAGHFSASSALAADYSTRLTTTDLVNSLVDMSNSIIFSAGCHAGYNLVNEHAVPNITPQPDWAAAFAQKGATLLAGTGYQYGDTDFIEYSERLYLEFSRQLRTGLGPISIGTALIKAKQNYLVNTAVMRPIHEKALLEMTLYGLPMLRVNLSGERILQDELLSIVAEPTLVETNPGATLALKTSNVTIYPSLTMNAVELTSVTNNEFFQTAYLSGGSGIITNPAEPVLPLEKMNVSISGTILRGVGFRSGVYTDIENYQPFTGAPTTELRGIHPPFSSSVFFPVQPWHINYFSELINADSGITQLQVIPAQFRSDFSDLTGGKLRQFEQMDFRLFYNNNIQTYAGNSIPALAAAPSIINVGAAGTSSQLDFSAVVLANPSVGVQSVWVTYTAVNGPLYGHWQSLDLVQNSIDSTNWSATLPLASTAPEDIRYFIQAVNGVGLVSLSTNIGQYYIPNMSDSATMTTDLELTIPEIGVYGTTATIGALLTSDGVPLSGKPITLRIGNQSRVGLTQSDGRLNLNLSLLGLPGQNTVSASYSGSPDYLSSSTSELMEIIKGQTQVNITLNASHTRPGVGNLLSALLTAGSRPLTEKTLFFVFENGSSTYTFPEFTNFTGKAFFDTSNLPKGNYNFTVYFGGPIPFNGQIVTLEDDRYLSSLASGTLIIDGPPEPVDDIFVLDEDSILEILPPGVLENDLDQEGGILTATLVDEPQNGVLNLNLDGSFNYLPNPDYFGTDIFTYNVSDSLGGSPTNATATLIINNVNDAPVAFDDTFTLDQKSSLNLEAPGVLINDSDVDNENLSAQLVSGPEHGSIVFESNGSFVYTPSPTYFGLDSFTYQASDGTLLSEIAVVNLTINQTNFSPDCSQPVASLTILWPPNNAIYPVRIFNVTDPDMDSVSIRIDRIFQDEPVGKTIDGFGIGTGEALLRAERDGNSNGRVYHVFFSALDNYGGVCSGELLVPVVAHDAGSGIGAIDDGALYDSSIPSQ